MPSVETALLVHEVALLFSGVLGSAHDATCANDVLKSNFAINFLHPLRVGLGKSYRTKENILRNSVSAVKTIATSVHIPFLRERALWFLGRRT